MAAFVGSSVDVRGLRVSGVHRRGSILVCREICGVNRNVAPRGYLSMVSMEAGSDAGIADSRCSRRQLLSGVAGAVLAAAVSAHTDGTGFVGLAAPAVDDTTKAVKMLSSLGVPAPKVPGGFTLLFKQLRSDVALAFVHPSAWLVNEEFELEVDRPRLEKSRPKSMAAIRSADFRRAEEVGVFVQPVPAGVKSVTDMDWKQLARLVVGEEAVDLKLVKREAPPGVESSQRVFYEFRFVTVTDAAYAFERHGALTAEILDGTLYVFAGQANDPRWKKSTGAQILTSVQSFTLAKSLK
ncbi:hypothetical protein FVE85_9529 [Porphyridium purpureum]|uniref:PsbP C-terminal domain-containing protein n=1 Tax=Porphyridium purpureum TaxID=35688 RepID=A0A5J4YKI5_PORPP|nr:hypothetical protein FVE85_9529 [Porphyridium purpureum]|eukprot:POR5985..scf261_15